MTKLNLDFLKHPAILDAKRQMEESFSQKRRKGTLSSAHDERHVNNVARCAGVIAYFLAKHMSGYNVGTKVASVSACLAGYYHDITREATEEKPHSSSAFDYMMERKDSILSKEINELMFNASQLAVNLHEKSIPEVMIELGIEPDQEILTLNEIVAMSLKLADGAIEASGYRVIERRCFFVGRERFLKEGGDLGKKYYFPADSAFAVLSETLLRLYGKLPIDSYPFWFRNYGEKLHSVQYEFLTGLLVSQNLTEIEAAEWADFRRYPKFEGILEKVKKYIHLNGWHFNKDDFPILSAKIDEMMDIYDNTNDLMKIGYASRIIVWMIASSPSNDVYLKRLGTVNSADDNKYLKKFSSGILSASRWDDERLHSLYNDLSKS